MKWVPRELAEIHSGKNLGGLGGFFEHGMRWQDLLNRYADTAHPCLEELREGLIKQNIQWTGEQSQKSGVVPMVSDGYFWMSTWRGWGDLMAAIWSTQLGQDYGYMDFYM